MIDYFSMMPMAASASNTASQTSEKAAITVAAIGAVATFTTGFLNFRAQGRAERAGEPRGADRAGAFVANDGSFHQGDRSARQREKSRAKLEDALGLVGDAVPLRLLAHPAEGPASGHEPRCTQTSRAVQPETRVRPSRRQASRRCRGTRPRRAAPPRRGRLPPRRPAPAPSEGAQGSGVGGCPHWSSCQRGAQRRSAGVPEQRKAAAWQSRSGTRAPDFD